MKSTIRPATPRDIEAIYDISCRVHLSPLYRAFIPGSRYEDFKQRFTHNVSYFSKTYSPRIRQRLTDPSWFYWVAEVDGVVRGFTLAHKTEGELELKGLFVEEAFQGQGIGKQLFEVSCSIREPGERISLEVISKNDRAIGMYKRLGFHRVNSTPEPFFGAPMLCMQKH